jgi:hypothetical protein
MHRIDLVGITEFSIWADRDLIRAQSVWSDFIITGPEMVMGGRTPGAAYYYFLWFIQLLTNDPEKILYLILFVYFVSGLILFLLAKKYIGMVGAFATAAIFSGMLRLGFDFTYWIWNPSFLPFFFALSSVLILRIFIDGKINSVPWLFFLSSIGGQFHFSSYVIIPIVIIMFYFFKVSLTYRQWLGSILLTLLPLSPFFYGQLVNNYADIDSAFDGMYQRYLLFNYTAPETSISIIDSFATRLNWLGGTIKLILGLQTADEFSFFSKTALNSLNFKFKNLATIVTLSATSFISFLFLLNLYFFYNYKLFKTPNRSIFKLNFFEHKVKGIFLILILIALLSAVFLRNYISSVYLDWALPLVLFSLLGFCIIFFGTLSLFHYKFKNSHTNGSAFINIDEKEFLFLKIILSFLVIGTLGIITFGVNVAPRYLGWTLPMVSLGGGFALSKICILSNKYDSKKWFLFFIAPFCVWMFAHTWSNSFSLLKTSSLSYTRFSEIISIAKQDIGLSSAAIKSNVLYLEYHGNKERFFLINRESAAPTYLIQQTENKSNNARYTGCLAIIDAKIARNSGFRNSEMTPNLFRDILERSVELPYRSIIGSAAKTKVEWIREKGQLLYVGYRMPDANCFNNIVGSYDLSPQEIVANNLSKSLGENTSIELESNGNKKRYVGKLKGTLRSFPIIFLIDLFIVKNSIYAELHSNELRGYNGITTYALVNPKLTLESQNGGVIHTIPLSSGNVGNVETKLIIAFPPWRSITKAVPPGPYKMFFSGDDVLSIKGVKNFGGTRLRPFTIRLSDKINIK